jgi:hypothetical protein
MCSIRVGFNRQLAWVRNYSVTYGDTTAEDESLKVELYRGDL